MKQHTLLKLLCDAYPNVFVITISFKEKKVFIDAAKPKWSKVYSYKDYTEKDVNLLSKEILNAFNKRTAVAVG